jgi:hypothetical protein
MAETLAGPTNLHTRGIARRDQKTQHVALVDAVFNLQSCAIARHVQGPHSRKSVGPCISENREQQMLGA